MVGNKPVHVDVLVPSLPDVVKLGEAVEERFKILCAEWLRIRGVGLPIPPTLDADLLAWRQMRVRHKQGDLRNSEKELRATRAVAQWTVDMYRELKRQPPVTVQWRS